MYSLSEQQIDFILEDIRAHGIRLESLQSDLLDHICILIEQGLEEGGDFGSFYASVIRTFYKQELREIEEETLFLLDVKSRLLLSRSQFFLLLFGFFIGPFLVYDLSWLVGTGRAAAGGIPVSVWSASLVFSLYPLLVWLVLFLTPERLDPLIPRKSKVLLGIRPFIKIIPPQKSPGGREIFSAAR